MNLYTKREAADRLKISVRTLERLLASGNLRAYNVGRSVRISEEQLETYLQFNRFRYIIPKNPNAGSGGSGKKKVPRTEYVPGMKVV